MTEQNDGADDTQPSQTSEVVPFEDVDADTGMKVRGEASESGLHGLIQYIDTEDCGVKRANYTDWKLHGLLGRYDKGEKIFEQEFVIGIPNGLM